MRVNKITEITVIMCACIDGLYITITLSHKYLVEYCNTIVIL